MLWLGKNYLLYIVQVGSDPTKNFSGIGFDRIHPYLVERLLNKFARELLIMIRPRAGSCVIEFQTKNVLELNKKLKVN